MNRQKHNTSDNKFTRLISQLFVKLNSFQELNELYQFLKYYNYLDIHNISNIITEKLFLQSKGSFVICVDTNQLVFWQSNITALACASSSKRVFLSFEQFRELHDLIYKQMGGPYLDVGKIVIEYTGIEEKEEITKYLKNAISIKHPDKVIKHWEYQSKFAIPDMLRTINIRFNDLKELSDTISYLRKVGYTRLKYDTKPFANMKMRIVNDSMKYWPIDGFESEDDDSIWELKDFMKILSIIYENRGDHIKDN